jgi:hypothetical protein
MSRVEGRVMQRNKIVPVEGITVTVFKHVMMKTERIGQAKTNSSGYYTINYEYEERKEGETLCLLIFVGDPKNRLATATRFDPELIEEVNFFV